MVVDAPASPPWPPPPTAASQAALRLRMREMTESDRNNPRWILVSSLVVFLLLLGFLFVSFGSHYLRGRRCGMAAAEAIGPLYQKLDCDYEFWGRDCSVACSKGPSVPHALWWYDPNKKTLCYRGEQVPPLPGVASCDVAVR